MSKTNKCHKTSGYSTEHIEKEVALMKRYPLAGDWRRIDKASNKVEMTYLLQNWDYFGERLGAVKHICPWGMKDTMTSLLSDRKCKNKSVLPSMIKDLIADRSYSGEWPSGLRRCNKNRKIPGSKPARRSAGLRDRTSLRGSR